jgi:hypothetical protein
MTKLETLLEEVRSELTRATERYPAFNTAHEGYAVLLEEVDELKTHVWMRQGLRITHAMRAEAVQVAAMALRFALDICSTEDRAQR